jgi:hypothetical protein
MYICDKWYVFYVLVDVSTYLDHLQGSYCTVTKKVKVKVTVPLTGPKAQRGVEV